MIGGGLGLVEIETGGENALVAVLRHLPQRVLALPGLDQNAFRQVGMVDLVPADHLPVMLLKDRLQFTVEVRLQRVAVRQPVVAHKLLNGRVRFPLGVIHLVTADMQIRIGEDRRQFANHRVSKGVGCLFCGIQHRLQHAPVALHCVWPRGAHQLRIGYGNRRGVARHVDLRHHADTALGGVAHHLTHLFRRVEQPVAGKLRQLRIALRAETPALVVGQVPVQDVELRRGHAVDLTFDIRQRDKVTRRVEQQPTPREARRIFNGDPRQRGVFRAVLHQLEQRFHGAQRAEAGVSGDIDAVGVYREPIAFIAVRQRLRFYLFSDGNADSRFVWLFSLRLQRPAGLQGNALAQAVDGVTEIVPADANGYVVAEHQRALGRRAFNLRRPGHQGEIACRGGKGRDAEHQPGG